MSSAKILNLIFLLPFLDLMQVPSSLERGIQLILNQIFLLPLLDLIRVPSSFLCEFRFRIKEEFSCDFKSNFFVAIARLDTSSNFLFYASSEFLFMQVPILHQRGI